MRHGKRSRPVSPACAENVRSSRTLSYLPPVRREKSSPARRLSAGEKRILQCGIRALQRFHREGDGVVFRLFLRKLVALLRECGFKLGGVADGAAAAGGVVKGALRFTTAPCERVERSLRSARERAGRTTGSSGTSPFGARAESSSQRSDRSRASRVRASSSAYFCSAASRYAPTREMSPAGMSTSSSRAAASYSFCCAAASESASRRACSKTPRFSSCAARTLRALFQFKTRSAASAAAGDDAPGQSDRAGQCGNKYKEQQ